MVHDEQPCTSGSDPRSRRIPGSTIATGTRKIRSVLQCAKRTDRASVAESLLCLRFGCGHLWAALAYVDRNPVRAGLVASGGDYRWSSASAHLTGADEFRLIDMGWWEAGGAKKEWPLLLGCDDSDAVTALRAGTYAGRPFGDEAFMTEIGARFGRQWNRGRPRKKGAQKEGIPIAEEDKAQFSLF
jgi:hypothetical protein